MKASRGQQLSDYLDKNGQPDINPYVKVDDSEYPYALKCWNCGEIDANQRHKYGTKPEDKHMSILCTKCWYSLPDLEF